jgi:Co/Zn/Cd efflux system component
MRSAWICTRNDVLGNLAVLLAAIGVFGTGTGWPDIIVAAIMAFRDRRAAGIGRIAAREDGYRLGYLSSQVRKGA